MYREALQLSCDGETVDVEAFVSVARQHGLSAWQMDYAVAMRGGEGAVPDVPAQAGPEHDAALFLLLDGALDSSEDLMEQLDAVKDKLGDTHPTTVKIIKQFALFQRKFEVTAPTVPAATSLRLLVVSGWHV